MYNGLSLSAQLGVSALLQISLIQTQLCQFLLVLIIKKFQEKRLKKYAEISVESYEEINQLSLDRMFRSVQCERLQTVSTPRSFRFKTSMTLSLRRTTLLQQKCSSRRCFKMKGCSLINKLQINVLSSILLADLKNVPINCQSISSKLKNDLSKSFLIWVIITKLLKGHFKRSISPIRRNSLLFLAHLNQKTIFKH